MLATAGVVVVGLSVAPAAPAAARAATLKAEYTFDVTEGGVVDDLTGLGHTMTLTGSWSVTEGVSTPAVAFGAPSMGKTPHDKALNPRAREFAVTAVFRIPQDTSGLRDTPNMVQKGLYGDPGQWKMQLNPGPAAVQCRLKGSLRAYLITSAVSGVDDGNWHTATCWRTGGVVGVTVDGIDTQHTINVGDIANGRPLQVGAKRLWSTGDQFPGVMDYVAVAMGEDASARSREAAPH